MRLPSESHAGLLALAIACAPAPAPTTASPSTASSEPNSGSPSRPAQLAEREATSVSGTPLLRPTLPDELYATRYDAWMEAKQRVEQFPDELDAHVWFGRRTAYLGRYRDSVEVYSHALQKFPNEPHLLRHRGHRYITLRDFDAAIADLSTAAQAVQGMPSEVEPDGLPNAAGVPTTTLQTNIYYHLGLAYFLVGRFEDAAAAYRSGLEAATTDDTRVATTHWLYTTLRRLNKSDEAVALLTPYALEPPLYENFSYWRLLKLYRREVLPAEAIAADASDLDRSTLGFGLGHWQWVEGDKEAAAATWRQAAATEQWAAFGYIAAEVELARLNRE